MRSILIFTALFWCISAGAQTMKSAGLRLAKILPEDIEQVNQLKKEYEDEGVVSLWEKIEYSFDVDETDGSLLVTAGEEYSCENLALKDNFSFRESILTDDESGLEWVYRTSYSGDKKIEVNPNTADFQSGSYFHTDYKINSFNMYYPARASRMGCNYLKSYQDVKYLTSVYFNGSIPVLEKSIIVNVPFWLEVDMIEMNFEGFDVEHREVRTEDGIVKHIYTARNLDGFYHENMQPGKGKIYPHLLLVFRKFEYEGEQHTLFEKTDDLYDWYRGLCADIGNQTDELNGEVEKILDGVEGDEEKIASIFYWVQDRIRYIAFENGIMGFKPEACQKVLYNRYGDCKGMANLTKEMLHIAGYDARLAWLGTNSVPYDYSIPSLAVDNHMICALNYQDEWIFLDPTEKYAGFRDYAHRIQGRQVMIEDGEQYILEAVPEYDHKYNLSNKEVRASIEGDVIKGKATYTYHGEEKIYLRRGLAGIEQDKKDEALMKYLSGGDKNLTLSNVDMKNFEQKDQPLVITFDFELNNQITSVGDNKYVNVDFLREYEGWDIEEDRKVGVEFSHKVMVASDIVLDLPEGFVLDYTPEALNVEANRYSMSANYQTEGQKVHYRKEISIYDALIEKEDFEHWNESIEKLVTLYNDQVILKKQ